MTACIEHTRTIREIGGIAGAGGNLCARSSVKVNLRYVCSPLAVVPQEFPTSGNHAGLTTVVCDATSTSSGLCLKPKTSPTVLRMASRICAVLSLRAADLVSKVVAVARSILSSQSPFAAAKSAAFF